MNSKKGGGKSYAGSGNDNLSTKGNNIGGSGSGHGGPNLDYLNRDIAGVSIDPAEQGEWEVIGKKSKNRLPSAPKQWGSSTSAPLKVGGQSDGLPKQGYYGTNGGAGKSGGSNWHQANDSRRSVGRGNPKPQLPSSSWESAYMAPPPAIPPPLQHGWQWAKRGGSSGSQRKNEENVTSATSCEGSVGKNGSEPDTETKIPESDSDGDEMLEDSDDDLSDFYDSDASQKSHGTRKRNKWFKDFFEALDKLTVEEISEQSSQWHCPACHNGPGAIDWYKGLQPLITHAKTKGTTRVKLHRELAEVLDEELRRRGTSAIPAGEAFGKWKGLRDTVTDHEIVWPPMVIIMNTHLDQDENDKWVGMGNQELLEYFDNYEAVRARHSYGPQGHRGMSLLLFEANAVGYLEAERLHKHFSEEGRDKDAWERRRVLFGPGGKRRLYGYLASKEDIDAFNKHCYGKSRLKYEMKSYQEMVVIPMKQMSEDNQQLTYLKKKVVKHEQRSKVLAESFGVVSQKLRETMEENRIVRLRTKIQHEENKEEMDYQEQFFKEQMEKIHDAIEEKERVHEKRLQECVKAKQFELNSGTDEDILVRREEASRFIDSQVKDVKEFEAEREKLVRAHQEKTAELRRKFLEDEVELEKEFEAALTKLMEKHTPTTFQGLQMGPQLLDPGVDVSINSKSNNPCPVSGEETSTYKRVPHLVSSPIPPLKL